MSLSDLVSSQVISAFLDLETQTEGDPLGVIASDASADVAPGQSVKIPSMSDVTVNASESASVEAITTTSQTLTVDKPAVINVGLPWIDSIQGLEGAFAQQVAAKCMRQLREFVFAKVFYLIRDDLIGATNDLGKVFNAGADALVQADVNAAEAGITKQKGAIGADLAWVVSPGFRAAAKGLVNYFNPGPGLGVGVVGTLNGYPVAVSSLLPSSDGDLSVATSASAIASNVGTQTVAAGHGFIRGGLTRTTGLTANASAATVVTATTSTTVSCAITAGDGAQADGVGLQIGASSLGLLCKRDWIWYAFAKGRTPEVHLIKREANAGWALQMTLYYGLQIRNGAGVAVHAPAV